MGANSTTEKNPPKGFQYLWLSEDHSLLLGGCDFLGHCIK